MKTTIEFNHSQKPHNNFLSMHINTHIHSIRSKECWYLANLALFGFNWSCWHR